VESYSLIIIAIRLIFLAQADNSTLMPLAHNVATR